MRQVVTLHPYCVKYVLGICAAFYNGLPQIFRNLLTGGRVLKHLRYAGVFASITNRPSLQPRASLQQLLQPTTTTTATPSTTTSRPSTSSPSSSTTPSNAMLWQPEWVEAPIDVDGEVRKGDSCFTACTKCGEGTVYRLGVESRCKYSNSSENGVLCDSGTVRVSWIAQRVMK